MTQPTDELADNGPSKSTSEMASSSIEERHDAFAEGSDGDGGERTAREQLKKTSIASLAQFPTSKTNLPQESQSEELPVAAKNPKEPAETAGDVTNTARGRPAKKRSFDDLQQDDTQSSVETEVQGITAEKNGHHKRMRSRDISSGNEPLSNGRPRSEPMEYHDEESDADARRSPGGAGVLVEPPARAGTPPPSTIPTTDDALFSPKKKRSRDQFDKDHRRKDDGSDDSGDRIVRYSDPSKDQDHVDSVTSRTATGEPRGKRVRDEEIVSESITTAQEVIPKSGFANTATASPFAAFASSKPSLSSTGDKTSTDDSMGTTTETTITSTSAFASSGISAFSSSERSPFSALGSSSANASGGFGSLAATTSAAGGFGSVTGFGGASPFAAKPASGFGGGGSSGFGGGFGAQKPLGGSLSSFGGPLATSSAFGGGSSAAFGGESSSKAFGAPANDTEEASDNGNGSDSDDASAADRPKDRRFQEQERETGEEAEETVFQCRAKLYHFEAEGKEWKERGVGTFKINTAWVSTSEDPESSDRKSRLIMRTDGVHRVVLNTPVFKGMKVGTPEGGEPTGKTLNITGMEGGKPSMFILKIGKEDVVKDLYHRIVELQEGV